MARRVGGARLVIPDARLALLELCRYYDRSFPGAAFAVRAAELERGEPVTVSAASVRSALLRHGLDAYATALEHGARYRLGMDDALTREPA